MFSQFIFRRYEVDLNKHKTLQGTVFEMEMESFATPYNNGQNICVTYENVSAI